MSGFFFMMNMYANGKAMTSVTHTLSRLQNCHPKSLQPPNSQYY